MAVDKQKEKSRLKRFLYNPWIVAIVSSIIVAHLLGIFTEFRIFQKITELINVIFEISWNVLSYKIPLWLGLLGIPLTIGTIYLLVLTDTRREQQQTPQFHSYTQDEIENYLWKWNYSLTNRIVNLRPICPICECCRFAH